MSDHVAVLRALRIKIYNYGPVLLKCFDWASELDKVIAALAMDAGGWRESYTELSDALGSDLMDSHAGRLARANRLAALAPVAPAKGECDRCFKTPCECMLGCD